MKKQKKFPLQQIIVVLLCLVIGVVCGLLFVRYMDTVASEEDAVGGELFRFLLLVVVMYAAVFLHLIVHEAGHLLFGLWTGYRFSSFRIGSLMLLRQDGRLHFKRLTVAGTAGQCLMCPPDLTDGKMPVVLYNLGGSLLNIVVSLLCVGGAFLLPSDSFWAIALLISALFGGMLAVLNGIPMRSGMVDNDGYNALSLWKNCAARRAFWVQMKINECVANGMRLKEMPDEWFSIPADAEMNNSMVATLRVNACNRLMDLHDFAQADACMGHLLEIDSAIVGLHRNLLVCDRLYCELIGENREEICTAFLTAEQIKFMKAMKKFPTVLRAQYTFALLREKDPVKAAQIKAQFEKCAKTYPYPTDIQSERELMQQADKCAAAVQNEWE